MKPKLKIKTIESKHVAQLTLEHYWPWDKLFDFGTVKIIGRMAKTGDILCAEKSGALRLISCTAFIDYKHAISGGRVGCKLDGEYVAPPHTKFAEAARVEYKKLPQLFTE